MIASALFATFLPFVGQDASELARVRAFDTAARIGLEAGVVLPPFPEGGREPDYAASLTDDNFKKIGIRAYVYNQSTFFLNVRTRQIRGFEDGSRLGALRNTDGTLAPRKVSDAQAAVLAQRFYTAAGWPGQIKAYSYEDGSGINGRSVQVHYISTVKNVPYHDDWQALMNINRETGQLDTFYSPGDLPSPPPSVSPRGALSQGKLAALNYGVEFRGESLIESPDVPLKLCIWYPSVAGASGNRVPFEQRGYGATVRAALAARRGILAYSGMLLGGSRGAGVYVTVDANTGEILDRADLRTDGGAGGGGGGSPAGNVAVPTVPRPWRVATGEKGWKAWSAPAASPLVPAVSAVPKGGRLVLSDGKLALAATYDPKTNLLGADGKTYRPGPALASLLRKRVKTVPSRAPKP